MEKVGVERGGKSFKTELGEIRGEILYASITNRNVPCDHADVDHCYDHF